MVKRVLMIAYHFPPLRGSSGIQRTLSFAKYLGDYGWHPRIITAHPRAYPSTGDDQLSDLPPDVGVERAFAMDTCKHLSFKGRYLRILAIPDRWVSWWLGAVPTGMRLVRSLKPEVIWSTYPIATAHLIGLTLHRLTGLPWVADLRDPMVDEANPSSPLVRRAFQWIERKAVENCARVVCTTPGALRLYRARFPHVAPERFVLISNGYDEGNFAGAAAHAQAAPADRSGPVTLVHSGIIYPAERNPVAMFQALALLQQQGAISAASLQVVLRATVHDAYVDGLIKEYGVGEIVKIAPHVPYRDALAEMLSTDGLLILQGSNCNHQIPAKLYECLRARRPILALTDPQGDTAAALRSAGVDTIASLDSKHEIAQALMGFLGMLAAGTAPLATDGAIAASSRHALTGQLAALLDEVALEAQRQRADAQGRQARKSSNAP